MTTDPDGYDNLRVPLRPLPRRHSSGVRRRIRRSTAPENSTVPTGPLMMEPYDDRRHAGRVLAARLGTLRGNQGLLVLGLPRGGVPVSYTHLTLPTILR